MSLTLAVLIATLVADLAVGVAAYKLTKTNEQAVAASAKTDAEILQLLSKQQDTLNNHEVRIVILERAA